MATDRLATDPSSLPGLPETFWQRFTSRRIACGDVTLHAVTGGEGPPLLLISGWPQTWYVWRFLMPVLAEHYSLVVAEPRGLGLSDKPPTGYDTGILARDFVALMAALGHPRFGVVGHDIGMWAGYALAADFPEKVTRLAVMDANIPGVLPSPPLFSEAALNRRLWHFAFNRLDDLNERMVAGREEIYFGDQLASKGATPDAIPAEVAEIYIAPIKASPAALHACFEFYRCIETNIALNAARKARMLEMPVLAIGGALGLGERVGDQMRLVANDVTTVTLPGCGHYVPEEAPEATLAALLPFLAKGG
ncbi:alpha/beta fold hydrolase [Aquabacter spiritensis]|uniref:Pimeloyl-ACP methyl ester carboxylesterase n=1 Tax=Aquabacter spiritensis TaxID=933073 RepID=A0A4R3M1E4_9HYPH|nr:alpha/beta hydrolase [Aquabacter spiritensis]TCT05999.1 pimeloyl-ACP methyl ester carboxylesterase [Aquabacter spiritensis]